MTEQPVETEQQFLGNEAPPLIDLGVAAAALPIQHYAPNAHRGRFSPLRDKAKKDIQDAIAERAALQQAHPVLGVEPTPAVLDEMLASRSALWTIPEPTTPAPARETNLHLEAEVHAGHAVRSLEDGELDAGIAWLQSALAFAQNARHSREFSINAAGAL